MSLESGLPGRPGQGATTRDLGYVTLDETNEKIIQLLARQGRSTMQDIADTVGRSESTVRERVATMEKRGIVIGYEARIDWALVGLPVLVLFEGDCPPGRTGEVAGHLHKIPNVIHAMVTTGSPNVVALVRARDLQEVNSVRVRLASTGIVNLAARISLEALVTERPPIQTLTSDARESSRQSVAPLASQALPARGLLGHQAMTEAEFVRANA